MTPLQTAAQELLAKHTINSTAIPVYMFCALRTALADEQAQAKPYTYLWEADGTCESVKGHVSVSSNAGPAYGWKVTPLFTHPAAIGERVQKSKTVDKSKWVNDLQIKAVFENYDEAQQVAVPMAMTEEHIYELAKKITKEDAAPFEEVAARPGWSGFIEIVRAIEAHHGITQGAKP